tara:strand:- start:483 stop:2117 length:1635 start_codon:yes stop_codon:yes gene_type:complete
MISWLQTNLQKHFRFVFILLLGGVIIAFVFTGGEGLGGGNSGRDTDISFYDLELSSAQKRDQFIQRARLSAFLNVGYQQISDTQIENYAFNRATALYLANKHSIPAPTDAQLTDFVQTFPVFLDQEGTFSPAQYNSFLDMMDATGGDNRTNIASVIDEEWRIKKIQDVLSGPGFVLQAEVLDFIKQEKTEWSITVAELDLTGYNPEIDTSDEKLQAFYEDNSFRYATPERRTISYISFDSTDFIDSVESDETQLRAYYVANIDKYQVDIEATEENATPGTEAIPFEAAKEQVTLNYNLEKARELAQVDAHELVLEIVRSEVPFNSDAFKKALEDFSKEPKTTAPFAAGERPAGTTWNQEAIATSFKLTESRYYSEPIQLGDTTLVLFLNSSIESAIPAFDDVKDQVTTNFTAEEKRSLTVAYGEELQAKLSNGFDATVAEEKMTVQAYSDFTLLEPAEGLDPSIAYSIANFTTGQVSPMTVRGDKGIFAYVTKKEVPEVTSESEDYAERFEALQDAYKQNVLQQYIGVLTEQERTRIGFGQRNG